MRTHVHLSAPLTLMTQRNCRRYCSLPQECTQLWPRPREAEAESEAGGIATLSVALIQQGETTIISKVVPLKQQGTMSSWSTWTRMHTGKGVRERNL